MLKKSLSEIFLIILIISFISGCNYDIPKTAENKNNNKTATSEILAADSFAYYENELLKDSMNIELHLAIATNYYAEKQFEKAINHLLTVCKIDNKNTEALITLGNIYYDTEQYENAIAAYEKALVTDKLNVNVRCDLATCYLNIKNIEKSYQLLKVNIKMAPEHLQSHHNLSFVYSQMGKTKEAEYEMKIFNSLQK